MVKNMNHETVGVKQLEEAHLQRLEALKEDAPVNVTVHTERKLFPDE